MHFYSVVWTTTAISTYCTLHWGYVFACMRKNACTRLQARAWLMLCKHLVMMTQLQAIMITWSCGSKSSCQLM